MPKKIWLLAILALTVIWVGNSAAAQDNKIAGFYKGATVKFIVPFGAGGDYDMFSRKLAPFLEKHTGARVLVENMPGRSTYQAIDYVYNTAKPDGLTILRGRHGRVDSC